MRQPIREVLFRLRGRYKKPGSLEKTKILNEIQSLQVTQKALDKNHVWESGGNLRNSEEFRQGL